VGKENFNKKVVASAYRRNFHGSVKDCFLDYFKKNIRRSEWWADDDVNDDFLIKAQVDISLPEQAIYNLFVKQIKGLATAFNQKTTDYYILVTEIKGWS
jgi:hypothetical protein